MNIDVLKTPYWGSGARLTKKMEGLMRRIALTLLLATDSAFAELNRAGIVLNEYDGGGSMRSKGEFTTIVMLLVGLFVGTYFLYNFLENTTKHSSEVNFHIAFFGVMAFLGILVALMK
jgi:uncharacterized membrane protein YeaQ/YmgE (transglycosylase-associated protein family)